MADCCQIISIFGSFFVVVVLVFLEDPDDQYY